ncbi:MAG: hypothetical protein ACLF0G_07445 [Candidatus Brocadiia bacterium]
MDRRLFLVSVVLAAAVTAPFLGKAFHADDPIVLAVCERTLRDPLRPHEGTLHWGGGRIPVGEAATHPPLLGYYLAPFVAVWGYSEPVLHAAMGLWLVVLAVGAGLLGRWFWAGPWWPMLFVVLSPLVVVSTNVMPQVPAAAMLTLGLALFVLGTDDERRGLLAGGSALVGLAAVTDYTAAAAVPLVALYPVLRGKGRYALWAAVPLGILGAWCAHGAWAQGEPHLVAVARRRAAQLEARGLTWDGAAASRLTVVGSMVFLAPALAVGWFRRRAWLGLPLLAAAGAASWVGVNAAFGAPGLVSRPEVAGGGTLSWQYGLWAVCGGMLLFAALGGGLGAALWALPKRRGEAADWLLLVAWAAVGLAAAAWQASPAFVVALVPLSVLGLRLVGSRRRPVVAALGLMLAAQAAAAAVVALADRERAEAWRAFAAYAERRYQRRDQEVWFAGHGGWHHYALREHGFQPLVADGLRPPAGAVLLEPESVSRSRYPPGLGERLELVEEKASPASVPARTADPLHCAFYAPDDYRMPYLLTFEPAPVAVGRVYRVGAAEATRPPE